MPPNRTLWMSLSRVHPEVLKHLAQFGKILRTTGLRMAWHWRANFQISLYKMKALSLNRMMHLAVCKFLRDYAFPSLNGYAQVT